MKLVLDRNSLEIEVYMEGDSLPAFWLAPYEPGEEVGEDEEVMEAPDWVAEEVGEDYPLYLVPRALVPELEALGFRLARGSRQRMSGRRSKVGGEMKMKKFNAQLYSYHPTKELLAAFLALPEPVGAAFAQAWWEDGRKKVGVALYALRGREGVELDWEAVVGPPAADFARRLKAWMQEEERMEAWLTRGGGNAQLVYTALRELDRVEVVWVWSELPPEPPPPPERVWSERALEERVDHALRRYRTFYAREAPRWFREAYPQEPTLPGVLALGKLKGYWDPTEEEAAARISRAHLG